MSHPVSLVIDRVNSYVLAGKFSGSTIEIIMHRRILSDSALLEFAERLAIDADKDGLFIVSALLVMNPADRESVASFYQPREKITP